MGKRSLLNLILPILLIVCLMIFGGTAKFAPADVSPSAGLSAPTASPAPPSGSPDGSGTPDSTPDIPATPVVTPDPEYFTITMIGDCTLASVPAYQGTASGYDGVVGDDYAYPFAKTLSYFTDDDFTFANLECSLTNSNNRTDKTFTFKCDPAYANIMKEGNVEFVTLANNHVLDYGQEGYDDTKAAVEAAGIAYAGRDEYAVYVTDSGLKIGVYAVSFGTVSQIEKGIAALKEEGAEFIIAALHWGDEGSYTPNKDQLTQGRAAIDAGADIVYGSHPHTLQPIEEYNGKYIYYSMGNWTFGGNTNPRDKDTFILRLTLERTWDGAVSIVSREHIPCACSGVEDGNNYQPVVYEKDSEGYSRVISKLDGSFTGSNLSINYGYSANE